MKRHPIDPLFLWLLIGLTVFGLVMLLSASGPTGLQKFHSNWFFFKNQLLHGLLPGVCAFLVLSYIDYRYLRQLALAALIASIILLVLVFIPGLGLHLGGAGRWVQIGPIAFQPSEFVKVTFILYTAGWLASSVQRDVRSKNITQGLLPFICVLGTVVALLALQPNTGSTMVIAGSALCMYLIAGAPLIWFACLSVLGVAGLWFLIHVTPYRAARFMTFLHPELDPLGVGYHINQSFLAIGSGGPFGLGYGHSRQKYLFLPEVTGDSIFAIMGEELGFLLTCVFIFILGWFVFRIFKIGRDAPDDFGRYICVGIGSWIGIQGFFNMGSMLGLVPITGVTLPFVSYGSSAFLALAIGMGLVASVSRASRIHS